MNSKMKFSIEYKRTVRVRKYTTFTMGMLAEFELKEISYIDAFRVVKQFVNTKVMQELEWLQGEGEE